MDWVRQALRGIPWFSALAGEKYQYVKAQRNTKKYPDHI